jgi:tetratricopeptide (TPR) repeat protein
VLPAYSLRERARHEAGERDWLRRIRTEQHAAALTADPSAKVGPIAAGPKVLASTRSATYEFIRKHYGDALAVEMEGHGFLQSVHMNHPVQGLVIRGISDLIGDKTTENDRDWQPVAARHAAAFAFQVLAKLPHAEKELGPSAAAEKNAQEVRFGDVTGNAITFNINQHQGPLTQVVEASPLDGNAEIDLAAERLRQGEVDVAIHLLSNLRKRHWNRLSPRERFRLVANLGHAEERKGNFREAARHFIEAKGYQPDDEMARSLEAMAYALLGDRQKACDMARAVLRDHPTAALAAAVRVRCAPETTPIDELEQSVPAPLHESLEVIHALGWRAATAGDMATAERLARKSLELSPDAPQLQEQLGAVIVQVEARAWQTGQRTPSEARLAEAVAALSSALAKAKGAKDIARLRYTRAEAYDLLDRAQEAETDFRSACESDKGDTHIPFRFAVFLERRGRRDDAIEVLRRTLKDAFVPQNGVFLANLLGERNDPGDRAAGVSMLQEAIPHTTAMDSETRAGLVATLIRLHEAVKQHDEAIRVLDSLPAGYVSAVVSLVLRADALRRAGNKEEGVRLARQALEAIGPDSPEMELLRVAEVLDTLGEHRDALSIWKRVLKPTRFEPFVAAALQCAKKVGDDGFVLSFCERLRSNGVREPFCLELEVVTRERYACFDDAIDLMQRYLESPADDALARVFRVRLSLVGLRLGRPDLVVTDTAKLPPAESVLVPVGGAVAFTLRHGPRPEDSVKYAYELVRHHFLDPDARQIYVAAIGIGDEMSQSFPDPPAAGPGCAVRYRDDDSGEEKWLIIEDSPDPRRDREEIPVDHIWAKDMLGKTVGEKFYLRRDELQDRTGTILAIVSKYVYRKIEILTTWEQRFPDVFFVRTYKFPTKEDGSPDISLLLRAADRREQQTHQLHALYRNNPISVTTFAQISKAGLLESLQHLASEDSLSVRCCLGNSDELRLAEEAFRNARTAVIDRSALATLFFSRQYAHLGEMPARRVILESTLQEYRDLQRKLAAGYAGFWGKHKGKYIWARDDPGAREGFQRRIEALLTDVHALALVESGRKLADFDPDGRRELIALFGQPTAEAIAAAREEGTALWTDDLAVAEFARERYGIRRVWTQLVFGSLVSSGKMAVAAYTDLTLFLIQWRYFFTRIDLEVILAACRRASWDHKSPPLAAVISWFGTPELQDEGAVVLCARALPLVWRHAGFVHRAEAVTRAVIEVLLTRKDGRRLVTAIRNSIDQVFGVDVLNAGLCKEFVERILRGESDHGLILPG